MAWSWIMDQAPIMGDAHRWRQIMHQAVWLGEEPNWTAEELKHMNERKVADAKTSRGAPPTRDEMQAMADLAKRAAELAAKRELPPAGN